MTHEIKLNVNYLDAVYNGEKCFEIRKNDRGYQKGDLIKFIPYDDGYITEHHPVQDKTYKITYVLSGNGLCKDFCAFSIKECENESP
jgi:hypothetical protein